MDIQSNKLDQEKLLEKIFQFEIHEKRKAIYDNNRSFVHYTSAENAIKILNHKRFWLRNVRNMNDYSEVVHGFSLIEEFFNPPIENDKKLERSKLLKALNSININIVKSSINELNTLIDDLEYSSFVGCFSEHLPHEYSHGRLSMWRAYGKSRAKVALVIDPATFFTDEDFLGIFSSPCLYQDKKDLLLLMDRITRDLEANREILKKMDPELISLHFQTLLLQYMICSKHQGFTEEREWRVVYLPFLRRSEHVEEQVEVLDGLPQVVQKLKLINYVDEKYNISIKNILKQIIIGPTENGTTILEAFSLTLQKLGFEKPEEIITVSEIPLRE